MRVFHSNFFNKGSRSLIRKTAEKSMFFYTEMKKKPVSFASR